jgi:hypothetical protein
MLSAAGHWPARRLPVVETFLNLVNSLILPLTGLLASNYERILRMLGVER